ncbi:processed acidic surface protein [Fictibacillus nanhaiensis]|uniref:processed acidic surface protein n=1 Tax=Fictibacillus nanhaiensis TaxID=742169 RepID=UPI00203C4E23|nr:processed acidic surface protein [Fictibacillus nanhaiensis]MCM3730282.1 processed acidic surface protein [Fictibacillus nanhaiensis]
MKHLITLLLALSLSLGILPVSALAIEPNDQEFEAYLEEIGWEKQDFIDFIESKEWYLEDFNSVDELGVPLSEEGVQSVLKKFDLSREELNELLIEWGDIEEGQDVLDSPYFVFNEDLQSSVDFYLNGWVGTPIDDENLQQLLEEYGLESVEALEELLKKNDDSIENYEYIEDLQWAVDFYINGDDYIEDEFADLFTEIDLTDEEMEKLFAHFETLNWEDPAFLDSMMQLGERMMAFEEFETADELSAEQIAEMLAIFTEMKQLLQIETKYYLVVDGVKQPVSLETLMTMDSTNGNDLVMEIYNTNGELLADLRLTAEMFGSELIQETGKDIQEAEKIVTELPTAAKPPVKTIKGGELPKTATNHVGNTLAGAVIAVVGMLLYRRFRVKGI